MIKLDYTHIEPLLEAGESAIGREAAIEANMRLESGTGEGSDMTGWLHLPSSTDKSMLKRITDAAGELRARAQLIIVIGIGGSYLGARAAIEALGDSFGFLKKDDHTRIVFAGQNLSETYIRQLLEASRDYSLGAIVVSKSGTTLEPATALHIVKAEIERRYGSREASGRIIAVTDRKSGELRSLADRKRYTSFAIPDNVGGRFSLFSPAGLVPIAAAGIDIEELMAGASVMEQATAAGILFASNPALQYASMRNILYDRGFKIEILATYDPRLQYFGEWWKQLYGESEGKGGRGIFPATVNYTADLHSMGQYIQDGERMLFETVVSVIDNNKSSAVLDSANDIPEDLHALSDNITASLPFAGNKSLGEVNRLTERAVAEAHISGGVPNLRIEVPQLSEHWMGALFYMFERACGISGYMLGIDPFDQPGVEAYKKNLRRLLKL